MPSIPWLAGVAFAAAGLLGPAAIGEATYLRFLGFYGLVFPAYVLLFVGPWAPLPLARGPLLLFAALVLLLAPLFEAGFNHHSPWLFVLPTTGVVVWAL